MSFPESSEIWDVLVVGAGPAGSSAACRLAREGVRVLLVDRAAFPRVKVCGEGLSRRALAALDELGVADRVQCEGRPFNGIRFLSVSGEEIDFWKSRDKGLVFARRDLDDMLRRTAEESGASFLDGCRVIGAERKNGVFVVDVLSSGKHFRISTRLIVLATGAIRGLACRLGLAGESSISRTIAMRAHVGGLQDLGDRIEIHLLDEIGIGYGWIFPTADDRANVGVGGVGQDLGSLRAAFQTFLGAEALRGGRLLGRVRAYPLRTDFPAVPVSAEAVLVVGEAAGLVDPLTGEGIAQALESGRMAAETAVEALRRNDLSASSLRAYDRALQEYFGEKMEIGHTALSRLDAWQNEGLTLSDFLGKLADAGLSRGGFRTFLETVNALEGFFGTEDGVPGEVFRTWIPKLAECRNLVLDTVRRDSISHDMERVLEQGKMLRPLLVFLGCRAAGGDLSRAVPSAAAVEMFHVASLIHDDIMDDAEIRRGRPALHRVIGIPRAIVCGDYLIGKAFEVIADGSGEIAPACVLEMISVVGRAVVCACSGQFQDVGALNAKLPDEEEYLHMIGQKTAAPFSGALKTGAMVGTVDPSLLETLSGYGDCFGRAFQIRDDVLDFSPGQAPGWMPDRRPSLPLLHAVTHGDRRARKAIEDFLSGEEVDLVHLTRLLEETGSLAYARQLALTLVDEALMFARRLGPVRSELEILARFAVNRAH